MAKTKPLVILMILDSVRADILYNLIRTNQMPYLKKYIVNRATIVEKCFTTFPTNTMPGHISILTGKYANQHHIAAMRFWNLSKMQFRDYSGIEIFRLLQDEFNPKIKMIYEYFTNNEAFTSMNFAKGADYIYLNKPRLIFYYLMQYLSYKVVLAQSLKTFLNHLRKKPTGCLYVLWLPITDELSHKYGPNSPRFLNHLKEIDQWFFKLLFEGYGKWDGLNKLGLANSSYFFITADHGSFVIRDKSELIENFKRGPFKIVNKQAPLRVLDKCDLLIGYTDGFANLYVKNPETKNWKDKADYPHYFAYPTRAGPINLIKFILKIPSVSHVFVKKNDAYIIFSREGRSQIKRKIEGDNILFSYQILSGNDPFEYNTRPNLVNLIGGTFHTFQEWFDPLSETNYPILMDQIPRHFDVETTGDILFMGKEGYSFGMKNKCGTHDTGTANCSLVPLIMAGPAIKKSTLATARTVDIVPTILSILNKKVNFKQFDGRILKEIIER